MLKALHASFEPYCLSDTPIALEVLLKARRSGTSIPTHTLMQVCTIYELGKDILSEEGGFCLFDLSNN